MSKNFKIKSPPEPSPLSYQNQRGQKLLITVSRSKKWRFAIEYSVVIVYHLLFVHERHIHLISLLFFVMPENVCFFLESVCVHPPLPPTHDSFFLSFADVCHVVCVNLSSFRFVLFVDRQNVSVI